MRLRIAQVEKLKGITHKCPDCGNEMTATGEIQYNEDLERWFVAYWCPFDEWIVPFWSVDLLTVIDEATKNLDPQTLPLRED